MSEITLHEPGVYLNLREADYLKDAALGSTSLKTLWKSPSEWWWHSSYNPLRPVEKSSTAFDLGTAAHVMFLEGVETYDAIYGIPPDQLSHPNHLDLHRELQAACRGYSLPSSGTKEELTARLLERNPDEKILSAAIVEWRKEGKLTISRPDDATVRLVHKMAMRSRQELKLDSEHALTVRQAFEGGLSEVSVFWVDDNGVAQRARFDKLKPNITLDLKTFSDWKRAGFKQELLDECVRRGYVLQAVHYEEGRHQMRRFIAEGRVFGGTKEQRALLEEIGEAEEWAWGWVFAKTHGYPAVRAIIPDKHGLQFGKAAGIREEALANFLYYRDFHEGLENMWFDPEVVWEPEESDWPMAVVGD